jgi:hypothetical protein
MFGLLGIAEVLALVALGAISAPLVLRPARRGGPVHVVRRFDVTQDVWPAVSIEGRQSGLIPRLLALVGVDLATTFEVTEELITFRAAGLWRERRAAVPLSHVASAQCATSQPTWHLSAIGVIVTLLVIYAGAGRLTPQELGAGAIAAGVCGVVSAMQRTIELVIETSGGTTIALSFTALGLGHAITLQDVTHAAERITELAMLYQRRTTD